VLVYYYTIAVQTTSRPTLDKLGRGSHSEARVRSVTQGTKPIKVHDAGHSDLVTIVFDTDS
jgi:hypothetical protein